MLVFLSQKKTHVRHHHPLVLTCKADSGRHQSILDDIKSFLTTEHFKIAGPVLVQLDSEVKKDDVASLLRFAK
ncbi:hypothetical protein A2U01_0012453 [Trifolium medium]|uniref:Uncharacterized protein n=1 Tax=Trifolium medium TaxID=97028 RepID=A0A392MVG4_9FABA|nr:hypothetical protein [Trifolium medium]